MATPLLDVRDLTVSFARDGGPVEAVNGVTFEVHAGETVAVVGESGSGKSVSALAIMRLLPSSAHVQGSVTFDGVELLSLRPAQMRRLQGKEIAMIFQNPMTALNPVFTVGSQLVEAIRVHNRRTSRSAARQRAAELLDLVGIAEPRQRIESYPHELSGGMRQRAVIAMAIANEPQLLIADEPTTALDVTIQAQVMEVMQQAQEATGAAMLLITHDLGVVAGVARRVQVMYAGQLFEVADTDVLYARSKNPYTRGLLNSMPARAGGIRRRLEPIPGSPPEALHADAGCSFRPRCRFATDVCDDSEPQLRRYGSDPRHLTRCHHAETLPDELVDPAGEAIG